MRLNIRFCPIIQNFFSNHIIFLCNFLSSASFLDLGLRPQGWEKWPHFTYGSSGAPASIFAPLSKSMKSIIAGVVSGDGDRQRRRGIVRDGGGMSEMAGSCQSRWELLEKVGGGGVRVSGFVSEMGGILSKFA
jgi:hypothetical protein